MKNVFKKYTPILVSTFIFMLFALYNGYPLLNGDSVSYIHSGLSLYVPSERPIFYGLFLKFTSMGLTAWGTIFAQSFLLAYLVTLFIKIFLPKLSSIHLIALMLLISLGTISSWNAGQILPDIFTPMLFLSTFVYLRGNNRKFNQISLLLIIYLSIVVHYSHYIIATLFPVALLLLNIFQKNNLGISKTKLLRLLYITSIAWASIFASNVVAGNGFTTGKMSHVFLMGKLCENGILKKYLDKNCATTEYNICQYKNTLAPVAWEFVWDNNTSPVYQFGGIDANKAEYKAIIQDIITKPEYWPILIYKSGEATIRQVILTNIDESEERNWIHFESGHPIYETVKKYFPSDLNQLKVSRQNYRILNITFYDDVYIIVLLLSSFILLFIINNRNKNLIMTTYTLLLLYILLNAFVTATFGNVLTRLNSRTIWLIPMTNIVFIYAYFNNYYKSKN